MLLSDLGAEVLRVDRATDVATGRTVAGGNASAYSVIDRGRRSIGVDLKNPDGAERRAPTCASAPTFCSKASDPASPNGSASVPTRAGRATRASCTRA